ncbi:uncharacterized protein [Ptychodera flava]|uniref:uncharacterized protein n=1 Tax=Ptychodera flava TaxID=63121 RepID=UPI00396A9902
MCRSQPLLLLIFLVVFACNGVNAAKLPSTGSNEDLAQLPELERETRLSPQPAVNSDILLIYDKMVFLRLCLTYIKSCKISVLGFSGGVLYEWTVDFTLVGIYCQDIVIRVFERNTTYNLSIVYYDDSGNSVTEEQKTIVTGLDSCPVACVYGEPHFRTYDGFRYPYQGDEGCLITLTMDCRERDKGTLTVQIDLEKSPLSTDASLKTRLKSVRILAYGRLYRMMKGGIVQVSFGDDLGGKGLPKIRYNVFVSAV